MLPNRDDYKRQLDKLMAVDTAVSNYDDDQSALSRMSPGMKAKGGGVTGFIEEVIPETGMVTVVNWEEHATVPARRVELLE